MKIIYGIISLALLQGCSSGDPDSVGLALKKAGANRHELEKVLDHYRHDEDSLRLKAAWFLISNMDGRHSFKGELPDSYDSLFRTAHEKIRSGDTYIHWDSLEKSILSGGPDQIAPAPDLENIRSEYLISNIDKAFESWHKPMARHLTFGEFCEYLLPYRIADEPLEDWRKIALDKYGKLIDSAQKNAGYNDGCDIINTELMKHYQIGFGAPVHCPYTRPLQDLMLMQAGSCTDAAEMTTQIMRAGGVPVGIDFIPNWGNSDLGHSWNVFLSDHKDLPFMGTESNPGLTKLGYFRKNTIFRRLPKVYRQTFAIQQDRVSFLAANHNDVPDFFQNVNMIDVTSQYTPVTAVHIQLNKITEEDRSAYLCVFDNKAWRPVGFTALQGNDAVFKDMGRGIVYLPMYYRHKTYTPAGDPFLLDQKGALSSFVADTSLKRTTTLSRKYPEDESNLVEPGDHYELFYWHNGWVSLGQQTAAEKTLTYNNVPENALLLLRDLTKGKQERIFTYKNNQQIWW